MSEDRVRVAVRVRPISQKEVLAGCRDCTVFPSRDQIILGKDRAFTFDYVFGSNSNQDNIYTNCVGDMVNSFFDGYNTTIFAYGQTGTGKTYTMGTGSTNDPEEEIDPGIIPRVVEEVFSRQEQMKKDTNRIFTTRVSYLEIYQENVRDLLHPSTPSRTISVRDDGEGGIVVMGVGEIPVNGKSELVDLLESGNLQRSTAATLMNDVSSRSHSIFTIIMEQRTKSEEGSTYPDQFVISKFHLVDLAGSERAKKTGATGQRLKESVTINSGLLALGNVISALGDTQRRTPASHVPYRESKLTRLLQDSLGGNSKTLMIACISPADASFEESLNTLRYANRARNIRNTPVVNRDPHALLIAQLRAELQTYKQLLLQNQINIGDIGSVENNGDSSPSPTHAPLRRSRSASSSNRNVNKFGIEEMDSELNELKKQLETSQTERDTLKKDCERLKDELFHTEWRCVQMKMEMEQEKQEKQLLRNEVKELKRLNWKVSKKLQDLAPDLINAKSPSRGSLLNDSREDECNTSPPVVVPKSSKSRTPSAPSRGGSRPTTPTNTTKRAEGEAPQPEEDQALQLEEELKKLQSEHSQMEQKMQNMATEKNILESRQRNLEIQYQRDQESLVANIKQLTSNIKAKEEWITQLTKKEEQVQEWKRRVERRMEGMELEKQKQHMQDEMRVRRLMTEVAALKEKKESLQTKVQQQKERFDQLKQASTQEITYQQRLINELENENRRKAADLKRKEEEFLRLQSKLSKAKEKVNITQNAMQNRIDREKAEKEILDQKAKALDRQLELSQQRLAAQEKLQQELKRRDKMMKEQDEFKQRREALRNRLQEHDAVVLKGLHGLQKRLQSIENDIARKQASLSKIISTDQSDKITGLQQQIELLIQEQSKYRSKYESLQSVVAEGSDLFFQQNVATELRNVEDHLDTLDAALEYGQQQIDMTQREIQALGSDDLDTEVAGLTLCAEPPILHTLPPTPSPVHSTDRDTPLVEIDPINGLTSESLELRNIVCKYHAMIVELKRKEQESGRCMKELQVQHQEDLNTIKRLEHTLKLMESHHKRQLERTKEQSRQLLQQVLEEPNSNGMSIEPGLRTMSRSEGNFNSASAPYVDIC